MAISLITRRNITVISMIKKIENQQIPGNYKVANNF